MLFEFVMEKGWNESVWDLVAMIPHGRVASYGQLALMLGHPRRARQVGFALHRSPPGKPIPWHRVINGKGRISFPENSRRYLMQRAMLEGEHIVFGPRGTVNFKLYGWRP